MIVPTLLAIGATENGAPAFMLVHPLKTGGSTVKEVLKQYALRHNSSQTVSNCETPSYPSVGRTGRRETCIEIAARLKAHGAITLGMVRDPLDRLVSQYFQDHIFQLPNPSQCKTTPGLMKWMKSSMAENRLYRMYGGEGFLLTDRPSERRRSPRLEAIDHFLPTDRLDEGLVLLHLRFRLPIWELLHSDQKVRAVASSSASSAIAAEEHQKDDAARGDELMRRCFPSRVAGVENAVHQTCAVLTDKGSGGGGKAAEACRGLVRKSMLSSAERAAATRITAGDEELWAAAKRRYALSREAALAARGLGEADLARLVVELHALNQGYLRGIGCNATLLGQRWECPPPHVLQRAEHWWLYDDAARTRVFDAGRDAAVSRDDQLLLRTFYARPGYTSVERKED